MPDRSRCRLERRILVEDPSLQLAQLERRLEAEIVAQPGVELLVDRERVGVPPGAVEREHRLPAKALAEREPDDLARQFRDQLRVATREQVRLDAILEADQAQLVEPVALDLREGLRELGQRLAAPQPERLAQLRRGGAGLTRFERRVAGAAQAIEAAGVDRLHIDFDEVAGRARDEHRDRQRLAQLRHVDLHHLRGRVRHLLAPQVLDQPVDRDRAVGRDQEAGEQRPLLEPAEDDGCVAVEDLHRAEQPELHAPFANLPSA